MKKGNPFIVFAIFTLLLTSTLCLNIENTRAQSSQFKISGYVLDSNGCGIAGADVIFNVPTVVPGVITDNSGYYQTYGPSGTYHLNVWPPFDTNYIDYDQPGFVVASDVSKNITLYTGYKVSGYVTDSYGTPVTGAVVILSSYGSGWFSTSAGYYFLSVPAGTYTINAHPRVGTYKTPTTNFPTYYEYNFTVNNNTIKNIVVGDLLSTPTPTPTSTPTPTPTPDSTRFKISGYILDSNGQSIAGANIIFNVPSIVPSVYSDNSGHYEMFAPAGTYHVNVWPPYDANYIDHDQQGFVVTSDVAKNITLATGYKVSGYIKDYSGTPIIGATIALNNYCSGWFSNTAGYYFLSVPAGTYTIIAHSNIGVYSGLASDFPKYTEYSFTVNNDTIKNIIVGNPTTTPTSTPTPITTQNTTANPAPTSTPAPAPDPTITPKLTLIQPEKPAPTFALSQPAAVQPNENSEEYFILLIIIAASSIIAAISLVRIFRSKTKLDLKS